MDINNTFCKDIDIAISSFLFGINIGIYNPPTEDDNSLEYSYSYVYEKNNPERPLLVLLNENPNHYDIVVPKIEITERLNKMKKTRLKDTDSEDNDSGDDTTINTKTEGGQNTATGLENMFPDGEEKNPFPIYTFGNDEELYYNIFKFLNHGVKDGKRRWPDYIENIKDRKLKVIKKADFRRKAGIIKTSRRKIKDENGEATETEIFSVKSAYSVENNRLYLNRIEHCNDAEHTLINKKYSIPFVKEIRGILYKYHDECNHHGLQETLEAIRNNNYFWTTMYADANKYLKQCPICNGQNKNN